jgi:hypothetical protein
LTGDLLLCYFQKRKGKVNYVWEEIYLGVIVQGNKEMPVGSGTRSFDEYLRLLREATIHEPKKDDWRNSPSIPTR